MTVLIYGLICPIAGDVRYIGKSVEPKRRFRNHIIAANRGSYDHHTARWLRSLSRKGLEPRLVIIREVAEGERWQDVERGCIAAAVAGGANLTNSTAGGEGLDYIDPAADAKYRANLSAAMKVFWNTPERKEMARQRSIRAWQDPEITARRIASMTITQNRADVKARLEKSKAEVASRPEVKAAKSAKAKALWRDPKYRATIVAARNDTAFTKQQSVRLKTRWNDDTARNKMQAARWSQQKRAAQAAILKSPERAAKINAALSDPEMIKRRNQSIKESWRKRRALGKSS